MKFRQKYNLTETEINRIHSLRNRGRSWDYVATNLGYTRHVVQRAVNPGFRSSLSRKYQAWNRTNGTNYRIMAATRRRLPPDPRALEESERAHWLAAQGRTITAEFCGDPLPGRSALDKRQK